MPRGSQACRQSPTTPASKSMRLAAAPGVYSARYAGEDASDEDNLAKLLAALEGLPAAQRTARYRCVIVFVDRARRLRSRWSAKAAGKARLSTTAAAMAVSATTRPSCRAAISRTAARDACRRETRSTVIAARRCALSRAVLGDGRAR